MVYSCEGEPWHNGKIVPCDLEVRGSNSRNSLFAYGGKAAYTYAS